MNSIGSHVRLTIFGESHGEHVGSVLDGLPAGTAVDIAEVQKEVDLRRPAPLIGTARHEPDIVSITGGIRDGKLTGAPVLFLFDNSDIRSESYRETENVPRPGHADFTSYVKYRGFADHRGGGQFSGRLTAPLVAAGAVARQFLSSRGVRIAARVRSIHDVGDDRHYSFDEVSAGRFSNEVRCVDPSAAARMKECILETRKRGDSVGGVIECASSGIPAGLGEPFFDTVEGELSKMLFAIPAVKGVEFGSGFGGSALYGSENNDPFIIGSGKERRMATSTNNAGGINGGITNGMDIIFRVAVKPTSSIAMPQRSVDMSSMEERELVVRGRHDPCIVPRAVIVVEAACALVLSDLYIRSGLQ